MKLRPRVLCVCCSWVSRIASTGEGTPANWRRASGAKTGMRAKKAVYRKWQYMEESGRRERENKVQGP